MGHSLFLAWAAGGGMTVCISLKLYVCVYSPSKGWVLVGECCMFAGELGQMVSQGPMAGVRGLRPRQGYWTGTERTCQWAGL